MQECRSGVATQRPDQDCPGTRLPRAAADKAIPYDVYDVGHNEAWASVVQDHDTLTSAAAALRRWQEEIGRRQPRDAHIVPHGGCGGNKGYQSRVWKRELQRLADDTGLCIHVSHFPPGTGK